MKKKERKSKTQQTRKSGEGWCSSTVGHRCVNSLLGTRSGNRRIFLRKRGYLPNFSRRNNPSPARRTMNVERRATLFRQTLFSFFFFLFFSFVSAPSVTGGCTFCGIVPLNTRFLVARRILAYK